MMGTRGPQVQPVREVEPVIHRTPTASVAKPPEALGHEATVGIRQIVAELREIGGPTEPARDAP